MRYDPASLGKTLGRAFELVDTRRHTHATPWGTDQSFQFSVFKHCSCPCRAGGDTSDFDPGCVKTPKSDLRVERLPRIS
jgi:hypothetical protein